MNRPFSINIKVLYYKLTQQKTEYLNRPQTKEEIEKVVQDLLLNKVPDNFMNLSKLWEIAENREAWRAAVHRVRHDLATEHQQSCGAPTPIITPGRVFSPTLEPWPQLCD